MPCVPSPSRDHRLATILAPHTFWTPVPVSALLQLSRYLLCVVAVLLYIQRCSFFSQRPRSHHVRFTCFPATFFFFDIGRNPVASMYNETLCLPRRLQLIPDPQCGRSGMARVLLARKLTATPPGKTRNSGGKSHANYDDQIFGTRRDALFFLFSYLCSRMQFLMWVAGDIGGGHHAHLSSGGGLARVGHSLYVLNLTAKKRLAARLGSRIVAHSTILKIHGMHNNN